MKEKLCSSSVKYRLKSVAPAMSRLLVCPMSGQKIERKLGSVLFNTFPALNCFKGVPDI